jgi:hypothetical protein
MYVGTRVFSLLWGGWARACLRSEGRRHFIRANVMGVVQSTRASHSCAWPKKR